MLRHKVMIGFLLVVVFAESVFIAYFLPRIEAYRWQAQASEQTPDFFISGVAHNVQSYEYVAELMISRNNWLITRLDKCIELVEKHKNLAPIQLDNPNVDFAFDPNEPFYKTYQQPVIPKDDPNTEDRPIKYIDEHIREAMCTLSRISEYNLQIIPFFEKRLRRLEAVEFGEQK